MSTAQANNIRVQYTQYYTDANDRLTCKVPKSNELVPFIFNVSTVNLLCFIGNMQRIDWMYFSIKNVYIRLTKYQSDIICNKIQLQG